MANPVALLEHLQPLQFDWATRMAGKLMNYDLESTPNLFIESCAHFAMGLGSFKNGTNGKWPPREFQV
jgi:hypothetical protein